MPHKKCASVAVLTGAAMAAFVARAQVTPKFEVASVKACKADAGADGRGAKGANGGGASSSPVTLNMPCSPLRFFINLAYAISYARPGERALTVEGGPGWIDSDRYQINAKAADATTRDTMNGPMLRSLLEERFAVKVHRETREVPAYALTVAKGGIKLPPWEGTSCAPRDLSQPSQPPGEKPWCGQQRATKSAHVIKIDLPGATMAQFALTLGISGRMVLDKTGIAEKFDFHVEFAPDDADAADQLAAPAMDAMLAKLGLRLERAKGSRDFVVIDHVERPAEN